jgi:succinate-acetate transporter protein
MNTFILLILFYLMFGVGIYFDMDKSQINKISKTKVEMVKSFLMIVCFWGIFILYVFIMSLKGKIRGKK